MSAFFESVKAGDLAGVRRMVAEDSSLLTAKDEKGLDGFTVARYARQDAVAQFLLESGVELSIFSAAIAGVPERVKELLSGDPSLSSAYSHDGWTALHLAAFFGQLPVAEALIAGGADVNARSLNAMRNSPLHAACAGRRGDIAALLAANGADVNARQEGGWTPLHAAAQNGDADLAQLLISLGAQVNARAENNQNAMDLALSRGNQKVVEILEENGAAR
ncbi:MAG TPA: ankyrin repeat domain-containing protein [Bryobacteraceae bacterium]|jgi:ankyrin repeat protein|nr:ankyrin repeat domain-containing protein [Bryobacteraceae bacterium]